MLCDQIVEHVAVDIAVGADDVAGGFDVVETSFFLYVLYLTELLFIIISLGR
ncbi:MAG: hypothetical protein WC423_24755 [Vulcanimicrobiota bacterium]